MFYAFFNSKSAIAKELESISFGWKIINTRRSTVLVSSDEFGRFYIPNIGWFKNLEAETIHELMWLENNFKITHNGIVKEFAFEKKYLINDTNIELLKYSVPLLKQFYYDVDNNLIDVEVESITKEHTVNLTKAFQLIKKLVPDHFRLIQLVTNKCVIFNVDTKLRNSFATLSAHGTAFFNAYQDDYNEVFFVDDIAHQTGHIIFNAITHDIKNIIKIDHNTVVETIKLGNGATETRHFYVVFHALYTYYATLICLDACLSANVFIGAKSHEALGRIAFYLGKCNKDLQLIETFQHDANFKEKTFTPDGLIIYQKIKNVFNTCSIKWAKDVNGFDMTNQPYNFTYNLFSQKNPLI